MLLSTDHPQRPVQIWLFFTAAMVFAMAVIGAITRLTESGLSMVEWKPLIGAIPPLSTAEWDRVFGLYKQTPEFIQKNSWMELADFQKIFFWEWLHRLWGRLIGLVYALPLALFWIKGKIPQKYKGKLFFVLLLGGLQGVMGWYMVMSGLVDRPDVSHFRLAAHLMLALAVYSALLWLSFDLDPVKGSSGSFCQKRHALIAFALLVITITWGAFTAGLDGGMVYNTWPMMDAHWMPPEVAGIFSVLHDPGAVQFIHRWLAIATFIAIASVGWRFKNGWLIGMAFVQVGLGIATVLLQVPVALGALHQAGGMVLLGLMIRQIHRLFKA
ncbi:MAG: heme A synthase [Micavibrio aeruginosavorus]|uniref:Heme A synthase n=1 Tax=Micavibrio aeruginosavorus TaxID=349221 RepID=A0A2W5MXJ8_9BACT|nr:MAG: heme A synthase [Micavibrio aeruginosavorus]